MSDKSRDLPNMLLIVLDSARADKFSCYGYHRYTTPNIDKLAMGGVRFEAAITEAPWTVPSHLTLFTGLYPSEHGKTTGFDLSKLSLPSGIVTLPELLSEKGYATAGFSSNPWIGKLTNIHKRFDTYIEDSLETTSGNMRANAPGYLRLVKKIRGYSRTVSLLVRMGLPAPFMIDHGRLSAILLSNVKNWITSHEGTPFFTFINLMNCHNPYYPPNENLERFGDGGVLMSKRLFNKRLAQQFQGKIGLDDDLARNMHAYYDASLSYVDEQIGDLFTFLENKGILDQTLIVVLSDHGKTLTEHDRQRYPLHYVTDTNLRIPLVARYPKIFKPSVVKRHVQLIHVTQTFLRLAGITNSNLSRQRPCLMEVMSGAVTPDSAYSEVVLPISGKRVEKPEEIRCIKRDDFRLIESKKRGYILLNNREDPSEERDFSKEYPELVVAMNNDLTQLLSTFQWAHGKRRANQVLNASIRRVRENILSKKRANKGRNADSSS